MPDPKLLNAEELANIALSILSYVNEPARYRTQPQYINHMAIQAKRLLDHIAALGLALSDQQMATAQEASVRIDAEARVARLAQFETDSAEADETIAEMHKQLDELKQQLDNVEQAHYHTKEEMHGLEADLREAREQLDAECDVVNNEQVKRILELEYRRPVDINEAEHERDQIELMPDVLSTPQVLAVKKYASALSDDPDFFDESGATFITTVRQLCDEWTAWQARVEALVIGMAKLRVEGERQLAERDQMLATMESERVANLNISISRGQRIGDLEERLAEVRDKIQQAGNLLAVIHHDGGHHINAVGWKQACEDAKKDVIATRTELDAARAAYRCESDAEAVEQKRRIAAEAALETARGEIERLRQVMKTACCLVDADDPDLDAICLHCGDDWEHTNSKECIVYNALGA